MQVLKDELRHKILLESQHLFLQKGYDRTSLQMIADKVNISKSNLYHYFKNKEELFYELTDGAAEGLKRLIMRFRDKRFDPRTGAREYQVLLTEEVISLLLAEKYGLLLIMEQSQGTRYEGLRSSLIDMLAAKTAPLLADEDNWNRTHRLAGYVWTAGGILMMILGFFHLSDLYFTIFLAMVLIPSVYSYMIYRKKNSGS